MNEWKGISGWMDERIRPCISKAIAVYYRTLTSCWSGGVGGMSATNGEREGEERSSRKSLQRNQWRTSLTSWNARDAPRRRSTRPRLVLKSLQNRQGNSFTTAEERVGPTRRVPRSVFLSYLYCLFPFFSLPPSRVHPASIPLHPHQVNTNTHKIKKNALSPLPLSFFFLQCVDFLMRSFESGRRWRRLVSIVACRWFNGFRLIWFSRVLCLGCSTPRWRERNRVIWIQLKFTLKGEVGGGGCLLTARDM